jgi:uncharacterized protein
MISEADVGVAIIGAGPSGLAASSALKELNIKATVFDSGKPLIQRHHEKAADLAVGIGGAGLFSDGKFSYHPSGTQLYELSDFDKLRQAYEWCRSELQRLGIGSEPFPFSCDVHAPPQKATPGVKKYPAHYATLDQRKELIAQLCRRSNGSIVAESTVKAIRRKDEGYLLELLSNHDGKVITSQASAVILAMGRFGGLDMQEGRLESNILLRQLRYEFGIRLESHRSVGFLNKIKLPDVKRLWQYEEAEIRTFCTCREGEVWNVPCAGISALSGRSDGPPTEYSNFGLLARFENCSVSHGQNLWRELRDNALQDRTVVYESLSSFCDERSKAPSNGIDQSSRPWYPKEDFRLGSIRERLGEPLHRILAAAVRELLSWSPDLEDERTMCLFPAVEGVGFYPDIDNDLKVRNENIWCCGDIAGRFRGLIPSLVSGYYAGLQAADIDCH